MISKQILKRIVPTPNWTISDLMDIRKKAFRKGVWFRALSSLERGIVNLTIRYVATVKSSILGRTLQEIFKVLSQAIEQGYLHRFFIAGKDLAEHLSDAASSWGNTDAAKWKFEKAYILCLGMNRLSGWRYQ